ncbi:MAG: 2-oxoglutarate dehydrogenase complex dihydrolipoyllysine-residue succinyltransferase [Gemmataceae bacterium]|nr:2-oxoglutarate dehydrogenase complex dihydrolipoyllysine-residue succinyltransferase [Gemmataceae bacterium]
MVPTVGESISEATLNRWLKPDGAWVQVDEPIAELGTDKATQELPAPATGRLSLRVREGETVKVGSLIAVIDTDASLPSGQPTPPPPVGEKAPATSGNVTRADGSPATPSGSLPERNVFPAELATERLPTRGSSAPTVGPISAISAVSAPEGATPPAVPPAIASAPQGASTPSPPPSPAAARLLAEANLTAAEVPGTGRGGRITKGDVLAAIQQRQASTLGPRDTSVSTPLDAAASSGPVIGTSGNGSPPGVAATEPQTSATAPGAPSLPSAAVAVNQGQRRITREPMSHIRRRIAERLVESQQTTATLTTFNEADMSAIIELRQRFGERFEKKHGVKPGFMSFFVKAVVEALKAFPVVNARIEGQQIVYHHYYDIGVAVSTDRGLMVPVIRDADTLSLADIERTIAELARKAREGRITVQDLEGGTFTITNGGVFGSLLSTPILNPPQSAILGMHAIQKRPVVVNDQIVIRPMMYLALSYDHRLIDGREAVQFLVRVKECIENPAVLLLDLS